MSKLNRLKKKQIEYLAFAFKEKAFNEKGKNKVLRLLFLHLGFDTRGKLEDLIIENQLEKGS